jgi:hypothetical protein
MQEQIDLSVVEWARRIRIDQVPSVLAFLAARLLAESCADPLNDKNRSSVREPERWLTAGQLSKHLGVPESWVRTEERLGQIPSVRFGKYVRFKLTDVEGALPDRPRRG